MTRKAALELLGACIAVGFTAPAPAQEAPEICVPGSCQPIFGPIQVLDLNSFAAIQVLLGGQMTTITSDEIWTALTGMYRPRSGG